MSEPAEPRMDAALLCHVNSFAEDVHRMLTQVFPAAIAPLKVTASAGGSPHIVIGQGERAGIELVVDSDALLRLTFRFWCTWDSAGHYLAVRKSEFGVGSIVSDTPLFRYDYVSDAHEDVPAAHLNVHAHRDEVVFAMLAAGRAHRGKARDYAVQRGKVPTVASLHFPLGGHRFRPCLEDVIEFLIREFGLDTRDSWSAALRTSRRTWRERQLKAAVRDDPEPAAAALRAIGFTVEPPTDAPMRRLDRLHDF